MSDPNPPDEPELPPAEALTPDPDPESPALPDEPQGLVDVAVLGPAGAYEAIDTSVDLPPAEFGPIALTTDPALHEPPPDPMAPVLAAIEGLGGKVDRLQGVVDRELRAESSREKVVDRLHAELQEYKNDLLLKITRPIFVDLIQLHDDMGKMADSLDQDDHASGLLRDFQQGVEDVLYRQGVEPFRVDGEGFDARRQRAVSTVETDEPERVKTIAARLRPGFRAGEKVIRPELVSVFAPRRSPSGGAGDGLVGP